MKVVPRSENVTGLSFLNIEELNRPQLGFTNFTVELLKP